MGVFKKPIFQTKRLNVFRMECHPTGQHRERHVYLAFRRDVDCPMAVVTATVWPKVPVFQFKHFLEMIETNDMHRRLGLATEMIKGLNRLLRGKLALSTAVSDGGAALLDHLSRGGFEPATIALNMTRACGEPQAEAAA